MNFLKLHLPQINQRSAAQRVLQHWMQDFSLLFAFTLCFSLHRVLMITLFHSQIAESTAISQYFYALGMGELYDFSTASKWVLTSYFIGVLALSERMQHIPGVMRRLQIVLFSTLAMFLLVSDITFFLNYNDHYNQMVFGLIYDDFGAIALTVWKEYHPLLSLLAIALVSIALMKLSSRWLIFTHRLSSKFNISQWRKHNKAALLLALFIVFFLVSRGLQVNGPPISMKHAYVTQDMVLNRLIPNPLFALWDTLKWRIKMNNANNFKQFWPKGDVQSAIQAAFPERPENQSELLQALKLTAPGSTKPPKHIVLFLMESHSGWPVFPEYQQFGFSPGVAQLANSGVYWRNFLPASTGTIGAISTVVTGLPDSGLFVNYESAGNRPFETSIAAIFKRLGYKTRFFYGGLLGWQRLDHFLPAQGFEEVYSGGDMGAGKSFNEWGVDDQYLFEFIEKTIREHDVKSINVVMSTSNHPPYDIDLDAEGYPVHELPPQLSSTLADTLTVLGHLWYADKYLKRMVDNLNDQDVLFAITGDHTARLPIKFPGHSALEKVAVPFVLVGSGVQRIGADRTQTGSHLDIMPTLVELAAPKGFEYHSFGRSLLHHHGRDVGASLTHIVTVDDIVLTKQPAQHYSIGPGTNQVDETAVLQQKAQKALSWYRVKHYKEFDQATMQ